MILDQNSSIQTKKFKEGSKNTLPDTRPRIFKEVHSVSEQHHFPFCIEWSLAKSPLIITSRLPDPKLGKNTHRVLILQCPVLSHFSCVRLFASPWTVAHQAPLSVGFSRQGYWTGLPCHPPGDLPDPGIKLTSPASPTLASRFFTTSATWE